MIYGTPTMFTDLIEAQEKRKEAISAEAVLIGGAPIAPYLMEQISKTLNVSRVHVSYFFASLQALTLCLSRPMG